MLSNQLGKKFSELSSRSDPVYPDVAQRVEWHFRVARVVRLLNHDKTATTPDRLESGNSIMKRST
jgi:hypothetical protein